MQEIKKLKQLLEETMKNGGSVHMNIPGASGASAAPTNDEN